MSPPANPLCYLVDDDPALREMLAAYLVRHGLRVTAMASAEDMLERLDSAPPDLVVLDVDLKGMSGLVAASRMRQSGHRVPIVMLTALTDEVDRILGLEMGADDYQCKPFSARELLARIRALLRRAAPAPESPLASVRIGEYLFVPSTRQLHRGDEVRVLNTVEHSLLAELCAQAGRPVSRPRLRAVTHSSPASGTLRAVDAGVMRLRRLVEPDPEEPRYIQTVRGQGYMFVSHRGSPRP